MSDQQHDHSEYYTIKPGESDPKALSTVIVGAIGIAAAIVIVLGLEVIHRRTAAREFESKIIEREPQQLRLLQAEQTEKLKGYVWVDQGAGQVSLPIDRAMELVVEQDREARRGTNGR